MARGSKGRPVTLRLPASSLIPLGPYVEVSLDKTLKLDLKVAETPEPDNQQCVWER